MAQKVIFESQQSANQRFGCGCLVFLIAIIFGVPGFAGVAIANRIDNEFVGTILRNYDKMVPGWVGLIALVVGVVMLVGNLD